MEMVEDAHAFTQQYVPTLRERVARWFGFRSAYQPRPEETDEFPSYMVTNVRIHVSALDRIRILLAGQIDVEVVSQTDVEVSHVRSLSTIGVPWR